MVMMTARAALSGKYHGRAQRLSAQAPAEPAAQITEKDQLERRREDAMCLARQAGPGPRI